MSVCEAKEPFTDIEIDYRGFEIFIEKNPDRWRGDYVWSVSKGDECFESQIGFGIKGMITDAKAFIDQQLFS